MPENVSTENIEILQIEQQQQKLNMKEACHVKFDVISAFERPQVSPSGKKRVDQVPRDAPMSAREQVLEVFAHSCRQRTGRQRGERIT